LSLALTVELLSARKFATASQRCGQTPITVQTILGLLSEGDGEAEILLQYPSLKPEDIRTCLRFATQIVGQHMTLPLLPDGQVPD
jgi:hypothetical protein